MCGSKNPFAMITLVLLLCSVFAPGVASAYEAKIVIVPGGGVVQLPKELGVDRPRPFYGGIVGFRLMSDWEVDIRGSFISTTRETSGGGDLNLAHGEANLAWFLADDLRVSPYITAGGGMQRFSGKDRVAVNGGVGLRMMTSNRMAIRIDGRDVMYWLNARDGYVHQPELFAGVSFGFGGSPRDSDQDGVSDKMDTCPQTPLGARVNASGCPLDGDKDGVFDGLDRCDGTPQGARVDARGCPTDTDGDGVLDGVDKCSGTPKGVRVDVSGCPLDSDKDGVADGLDMCDATRAGCTVDKSGCPVDTDRDGVCDGLDKCPDTPASSRVDANGCPMVVSDRETELLDTGMIRLENVNFATGKAIIQPESFPVLQEVGEILSKWPELRIEIGGHTDSRGSDAMNQTLSDARAHAVLDYMAVQFPGLHRDQFTAVGYGESEPIADNTTQLGMAKNRRVEFRVLNKEVLKREQQHQRIVPK